MKVLSFRQAIEYILVLPHGGYGDICVDHANGLQLKAWLRKTDVAFRITRLTNQFVWFHVQQPWPIYWSR